jgi:hypothetical protein
MEGTKQEILNEIKSLMASIQTQVSELEMKLSALEQMVDSDNGIEPEAISISLEDFDVSVDDLDVEELAPVEVEEVTVEEVAVEPEVEVAEEPEVEEVVDEPEVEEVVDEPVVEEDMPLFGAQETVADSFESIVRAKHKKSLLDSASSKKTVVDAMVSRRAWMSDMPGSEVRDVRSAISLNDRVLFINNLFSENPSFFQDAVNYINSAEDMDSVVEYFETNYPAWNMESEIVYRFMMAVRRKVR